MALAIAVFPRLDILERLALLGPALAQDAATALLLDSLGGLSTFPVRHRFVFVDGDDSVARHVRFPASWREVPQRGRTPVERLCAAFDDLRARGAEAILLVSAEGPRLPLGELYDSLAWAHERRRVGLGMRSTGGLYALVTSERAGLPGPEEPLGLVGTSEDLPTNGLEARMTAYEAGAGFDTRSLPSLDRIDSVSDLRELRDTLAKTTFAPHCRKLFERPEFGELWPLA